MKPRRVVRCSDGRSFLSIGEAAFVTGLDHSAIWRACSQGSRVAGVGQWRYEDAPDPCPVVYPHERQKPVRDEWARKVYPSAEAASRHAGVSPATVRKCASQGRTTRYGRRFTWAEFYEPVARI